MVPDRAPSGKVESDRILGGGSPPRSLILVSGNPGTGRRPCQPNFYTTVLPNAEKRARTFPSQKIVRITSRTCSNSVGDFNAGGQHHPHALQRDEEQLRKEMAVLKARAAAHERRIMPFEITGRGIVLHTGR
jgi:KaiC/GvpD/RAD55 family RecA-like ATPase